MKLKITLMAAVATVCFAAAAPASAAILINGDFEAPGGLVRDQLTTNYIPGWTYSTATSSYDVYEADSVGDGIAAANGSHYVSFGHNGSSGGSISQSFATVVGGSYTLTYSVAEQQGDDSSQILRAIINNGAQTLSADNGSLTLGFLSGAPLTFIASGASATVTFFDATPVGGGGPSNLALDAANISGPVAGVSGVPEPAMWAMMLVGFFGLGAAMRSARRKSVMIAV